MDNDMSNVGQGKAQPEPVTKYDAEHGTYKDAAAGGDTDSKLATAQMPKGADPSPFTVGPMTPGTR